MQADSFGRATEETTVLCSSRNSLLDEAVDEFRPFDSEYEGYMGNYGNTLDRWYHRAAIALWQKEVEIEGVFVADPSEALTKLTDLLKKNYDARRVAFEQA